MTRMTVNAWRKTVTWCEVILVVDDKPVKPGFMPFVHGRRQGNACICDKGRRGNISCLTDQWRHAERLSRCQTGEFPQWSAAL
jgi:hypothetical protein